MANKFQIKRTSITGRTPNTTNVANTSYIDAGELAVNLTDQKIFTSNGSAYFEVGSNLASLSVQTITANGSAGSNGQVLTSNGSTVYWANSTGTSNVATQSIYTYTISSNTSTITGSDDNANTLSYTPGIESIFINGVRQISGVDYNTTNSSSVALTSNVISGDVVQVITWVGTINTVNVNAQYVWTNTHTFSNTVTFSKAISANGSSGTAGQVLASNGTAVYWTDPNPGDITGVTAGSGLSGGGTSGGVTVSVLANTGIVANADGVFVNSAYIATLSANNTTYVNGKTEANLNVNNATTATTANNSTYFDGATWAAPKAIGSGTANTGAFTTVTAGNTSITGFVNASASVNSAVLSVGTNFVANTTQTTLATPMLLNNQQQLRFQTINTAAYAYFTQQNDDNFVFYTSNTDYGARPVWSIYANSATSNLTIHAPLSTTTIDVGGPVRQTIIAVAALDIDCSQGNYFTKTINGNSTFTFSNAPASRAFAFTLELTHTSGTVAWPASVKWPGDTAPTLTTGKTHLFTFVTDDGGTRWRGVAQKDYVN